MNTNFIAILAPDLDVQNVATFFFKIRPRYPDPKPLCRYAGECFRDEFLHRNLNICTFGQGWTFNAKKRRMLTL